MKPKTAQLFLDSLAAAFDHPLSDQRRAYYLDALVELDEASAQPAFNRLIRSARRFPTLREILDAFEAVKETTHEIERSRAPSPESLAQSRSAFQRYLELGPVMGHPDLYWGYVEAVRQYQGGQRTREDLERLRQTLIEQAKARNPTRQDEAKAKAQATPQVAGIDASVPIGDR